MKIQLSTPSINDSKKKLEAFKMGLDTQNKVIVDKLVDYGLKQAEGYNASAPRSGTEMPIVHGSSNEGVGKIMLQGNDAVYDEFGTGEEGMASPHPLKKNINVVLNDYNSGPVVSRTIDEDGRHYWIYTPMRGNPYFDDTGKTYGIPAGQQMFRTLQDIHREKSKIINQCLNTEIKRINK